MLEGLVFGLAISFTPELRRGLEDCVPVSAIPGKALSYTLERSSHDIGFQ